MEYLNSFLTSLKGEYMSIYGTAIDAPESSLLIYLILFMLPVFFLLSRSRLQRTFLMFVMAFPGTLMHELLHFFVGVLTAGGPVSFTVIPKRSENGWTLGSVKFINIGNFNALPISMAPLLAPAIIGLTFPACYDFIRGSENGVLLSVGYAFTLVSLLNGCIPSKADFELMAAKPLGMLVYISIPLFLLLR